MGQLGTPFAAGLKAPSHPAPGAAVVAQSQKLLLLSFRQPMRATHQVNASPVDGVARGLVLARQRSYTWKPKPRRERAIHGALTVHRKATFKIPAAPRSTAPDVDHDDH